MTLFGYILRPLVSKTASYTHSTHFLCRSSTSTPLLSPPAFTPQQTLQRRLWWISRAEQDDIEVREQYLWNCYDLDGSRIECDVLSMSLHRYESIPTKFQRGRLIFPAGMCIQDFQQRETVLRMLEACRQRTGWPILSLGEELQTFWKTSETPNG